MAKQAPVQYTIRGIPSGVDRALRRQATATGRSLNEVAIEALARGVGEPVRAPLDLSFLAGSMSEDEAAQLESVVAEQRTIDAKLW